MDNAHADGITVFLAEDSAPLRARLAAMLSGADNVSVVGEAATPAAAIAGILRTRPRFVVLDIHLAEGRGIDVLRGIRNTAPDIVFIVLTNLPAPQYRKAYMQAGASYFFDKATEFEMVRKVVAASVANASSKREKGHGNHCSAPYC
jgi:two-component system response regulator DesR